MATLAIKAFHAQKPYLVPRRVPKHQQTVKNQKNMTEPLIIPLLSGPVLYLDKDHVDKYSNVSLVSCFGDKIKVNCFLLVAFSESMFETFVGQDFEDDLSITTNLAKEDLILVANFVSQGLLPAPIEVLKQSIPQDIYDIFQAFGINLAQVLFNYKPPILPSSLIKTEVLESTQDIVAKDIQIKKEEPFVKLEDFDNDFYDNFEDYSAEYSNFDYNSSSNNKKSSKHRRKVKTELGKPN
jgi:hypothetical protein